MKRALFGFAPLLVTVALAVSVVLSPRAVAASQPYSLSFALGMPASPQAADALLPNTDLLVAPRNNQDGGGLIAMQAHHGPACEPYPATHTIPAGTDINQSFYICHDHLMTAIDADEDQAVAAITPNALVDLSAGASITMPISTLRTSGRDWLEFWLTPFSEQLAIPNSPQTGNEFQNPPRDAIDVQMDLNPSGKTSMKAFVCKAFSCQTIDGNGNTFEDALARHGLKADASRRDTYQIDVSAGHVKMSFPQYNETFLDAAIPGGLGFNQAVFQFIQRSYEPGRQDVCYSVDVPVSCVPDSWHIGGISIDHAQPMTLLKGDKRVIGASGATVQFGTPAPANSYLRFIGLGSLQVSFDGGKTYSAPKRAVEQSSRVIEHYDNFLTPVPAGATSVTFKGSDTYFGPWEARNPIVMSLGATGPAPSPTPVPPTPTPAPTPIPLNNTPCMVTLPTGQQTGTCSGTFTPNS